MDTGIGTICDVGVSYEEFGFKIPKVGNHRRQRVLIKKATGVRLY